MTESKKPDVDAIEYGTEGKIPWGIGVIWAVYAVWAIWYTTVYSVPDLMAWLKESAH